MNDRGTVVSDTGQNSGPEAVGSTDRPLWQRAFEPVPLDSLVVFRIWFGLMMTLDAFWHLYYGWVEEAYIRPEFLFKFRFFEWVHPWPGQGMYLHFAALTLLGGCISLGLFYRVAILLFALGTTYVFLLDRALYLNHTYLICLLSWIMAFVPCHRAFSLDVLRRPELRSTTAPAWCLWLVRFQIGIPYFFGGIAKLETDWLNGDTVNMFFIRDSRQQMFGPIITSPFVIGLVTYGGLLFDLLAVPLLLWRRTRIPTFVIAVLFHLTNSQLFNIGIFPWLMIGATTIFFPADWPRRLLRLGVWTPDITKLADPMTQKQKVTLAVIGLYLVIQLLLPFRQFLYPGNPNWTDEGQSFCWRMMLRSKHSEAKFVAVNKQTGRRGVVRCEKYLTSRQILTMAGSPDLLLEFSHFLEDTLTRERGIEDIMIHAYVISSLNGRQPQLLVDPEVDLTEQPRSLRHKDWIRPLKGPTLYELRQQAGGAPLQSMRPVQQGDVLQ